MISGELSQVQWKLKNGNVHIFLSLETENSYGFYIMLSKKKCNGNFHQNNLKQAGAELCQAQVQFDLVSIGIDK